MREITISMEQYIQKAYDLIVTEGIQSVTLRRLAKELNCNTANVYRYFVGLDELIVFASLSYLNSYLNEVAECYAKISNSLELHLAVWDCFSRHSFANPQIYNNIFFGPHSRNLDAIIHEYYSMFSTEIARIDPSMQSVFMSGDFNYRDFLMVVRCVKDGIFRNEDAEILNTVSIHLYKGFLKDILDDGLARNSVIDDQKRFMLTLKNILDKFLVK